jgi:hypothetical protein
MPAGFRRDTMVDRERNSLFCGSWSDTVKEALATIGQAFPGIKPAVLLFTESVSGEVVDLSTCISCFVEGKEYDLSVCAGKTRIDKAALKFILSQLIKPFVEKRTEKLRPLIAEFAWFQGYWPICGEISELGIGKSGAAVFENVPLWILIAPLDGWFVHCGKKKIIVNAFVDGYDNQWAELCSFCRWSLSV